MNRSPDILNYNAKEEEMTKWSPEEKKYLPSQYGCVILVEDGLEEQVKSTDFPNDSYIVTYKIEDKIHFDLCKGKMSNVFDLYYDKFGKGSIQSIDFGYGTINPKMWGYKSPEKKKRK